MNRALLFALLTFAIGCGSPPPPYKEFRAHGRSPLGYASIQLRDDAFWVTAIQIESGYTNRLRDYALMRSAELTLEAGFSHFHVVNGADSVAELKPPYELIEPSLWNVIICDDGPDGFRAADVVDEVRERHGITTRGP